MEVEVEVMGCLNQGATGKNRIVTLQVAEAVTLGKVLKQLDIPAERHVVAIPQGMHLKRESRLSGNQKIQIFPLVDGG